MPKISAPTLAEHRERMRESLIDATENLLLQSETVTAAQVTSQVGIARNSLYKYFDSIDDLVAAVAIRDFPRWGALVGAAMDEQDDPRQKIAAYARVNLTEAAGGFHRRRVAMSRMSLSEHARAEVIERHKDIANHLGDALALVPLKHPQLAFRAIQALVTMGIESLDAGMDADEVRSYLVAAVLRVLDEG